MRRRNKGRTDSSYWIISALIHVVVIVLLILSPAGQSIFKQERKVKPDIVREDEELAEVIDDIRDLAVNRLKAQVELLEGGRERMAANFHILNEHYEPFVAKQIESVRDRLVQEGQRVNELQNIILKAAEAAVAQGEGASDPMWRAYDGNRAALVAGQEEIRRALMLTAAEDTGLVELQNQAEADQMEVFQLISQSVSAQNHLWGAPKNIQRSQDRIAKVEGEITSYRQRITDGEKKIEEYKRDQIEADKKLAVAKASLAKTQKAYDQAKSEKKGEKEAKNAFDRANRDFKRAESYAQKPGKRIAQAEKSVDNLRGRLDGVEKRLADYRKSLKEAQAALPGKEKQRDESAAKAVALQRTAIESQSEVYKRLLAQLDIEAEEAAKSDAAGGSPSEGEAQPKEDML